MLNHRVGRRVSVSQEDQYQRNGVILDQRSMFWNDDTGAVSRGGAGGFTGIFEIVAADKARVGRVKRRPLCEPYLTLGTLAARSTSPPCRPKGRTGQRRPSGASFCYDALRLLASSVPPPAGWFGAIGRHELATNAGKYGALSIDLGRVDVSWGVVGDTFTMSWTERDGPPGSAPK
jgi:hypothetical protein